MTYLLDDVSELVLILLASTDRLEDTRRKKEIRPLRDYALMKAEHSHDTRRVVGRSAISLIETNPMRHVLVVIVNAHRGVGLSFYP